MVIKSKDNILAFILFRRFFLTVIARSEAAKQS